MSTPSPRRIVLAGHNLTAWMSIPEIGKEPRHVEEQKLGPRFLHEVLVRVLTDNLGSLPAWRPGAILDDPSRVVPVVLDDPPDDKLSAPPHDRLLWTMDPQPPRPEGKKKSFHGLRIKAERTFRADVLDARDVPATSFSRMRPDAGPGDLAVVFISADAGMPPADALDSLAAVRPDVLLLHLASDREPREEWCDWLAGWMGRLRGRPETRLIVLTSTNVFGSAGLSLVDNNSWEALAYSLLEQWQARRPSIPLLEALWHCPDVIVRHKAFSALRLGADKARPGRFYYLVDSDHSLQTQAGHLIGYNSLITASLVRELLRRPIAEAIAEGLRDGVYRCTQFARRGYAKEGSCDLDRGWAWRLLAGRRPDVIHDVALPAPPAPGDSSEARWSVLSHLIDEKRAKALEIGESIVRHGVRAAQAEHKFPVVRFGKMIVADRPTFEAYWEIREVMGEYLREPDRKRPLSFAIFGAPGGGKSFGVKELAAAMAGTKLEGDPLEYNVSQFTSDADLYRVFKRVGEVSLAGKVPLVFFDEFDATWERKAFGWLRYFLAPMQDGTYGNGTRLLRFGRAIFVFIGGVNHTFEMFNDRMLNRDFIEAKGPDFVSRLARHLDILGIDRPADGGHEYLIRRAIVLRGLLAKYHHGILRKARPTDEDEDAEVRIDPSVLRAFLGVERFRHGIRSLEAIVMTSRLAPENPKFHWGALPPRKQLEMHVAFRDFEAARDEPNAPKP